MRALRWLFGFLALAACKRENTEPEEPPHKTVKPTTPKAPSSEPIPATPSTDGPRYLRPNAQGALVDAFQFPSVPASIVEQQVASASSRSDAIGILRRFGLPALDGKTGHVWIAKASLVDRQARERIFVASFLGDADKQGLRDSDGWIVFLGSTHDDRVLKIGNARIKTKIVEEVEVDARELHSNEADDAIATWSSCTIPMQKSCHFMRAWTMKRGYPEQILDVTGDNKPVISGTSPPHEVVVDGRVLKFDAQAFAYR
jgi:hypothetical protein